MTDPLAPFARFPLAHQPTPLEPLPRLSALLGGPRLHVKRDDCTGLAFGGNKARKLEFLVADALAQGADMLVTVGALQSNHARMTAAAAARAGLRCGLVLEDRQPDAPEDYRASGNAWLNGFFGAEVVAWRAPQAGDAVLGAYLDGQRAQGRKPYAIPGGGSSPLGALGYAVAGRELATQARDVGLDLRAVALATGSGGTQAGLLAGLALAGALPRVAVTGHCVSRAADVQAAKVRALVRETCGLLGLDAAAAEAAVRADDRQVGPGYAAPTDAMREAVRLLAETEGILLDPVYTGKAFAGLVADVRAGRWPRDADVVFLHTGGAPGLFGHRWVFGQAH
ncbi:D-cysteine desulfhydrase family protein [Xylophilus sp.]|uniref:D-cysteine desulfhydrase family protein n=1 Tax=Xylophilus sp. TaxID=2653893 RepID=UPI0013B751FA|nr:D-cysteine desulfhydrase family protein [Xylophilus sp.]KAF1050006.1 MAG: D-cysteine desulfhydrase [Xylophilus sp.]